MIRIEQMGKRYGEDWVFRGLDLEVAKGGSIALIGPSGSGKSVLLKIVAGLLAPDEGRVRVASKQVGMLFQRNALFDSLSVIENLLFPLKEVRRITGTQARSRALALLESVGLEKSIDLLPGEISGGMQKRLGIARALVVEPELILYDEPTAGLDPITSKKIADMIVSLRHERGSTLLTVTNDIHRACQVADQIYLLARGELRKGGTPAQVMESQDPAIHQFVYGEQRGPLT